MLFPSRATRWVAALACIILSGPTAAVSEDPATEASCPDPAPSEVVFPATAGVVRFPHLLHEEMDIPCESCHHATHVGELTMPHPEYFADFWIRCETCHRARGQSSCPQTCSSCHQSSPSSMADETLSSKVVIHQACWECHPAGTGSEASNSCGFCHQGVIKGEVG
jgi:hypothetical protein